MPSGGHSLSRDLVGAREGVLVSGGGAVCAPCARGTTRIPCARVRVSAQELTRGVGQRRQPGAYYKMSGFILRPGLAICSSFFSMIRNDYCHQNIMQKTKNPGHAVKTLACFGSQGS